MTHARVQVAIPPTSRLQSSSNSAQMITESTIYDYNTNLLGSAMQWSVPSVVLRVYVDIIRQ